MTPLDAPVSVFHGKLDTDAREQPSLGTMLERIQGGQYKQYIEGLRAMRDAWGKDAYDQQKGKSHAFTPCCALHTRKQKVPWSDKLISTTGVVYFDIDDVDDPEAVKADLARDPRVLFAFTSPSGQGVKVGVAAEGITGPNDYKEVWAALLAEFQQTYPAIVFKVDDHVKFLNALCYVSHDPALYRNPDARLYVVPPYQKPAPKPKARRTASTARPQGQPTGAGEQARVEDALQVIPSEDYDTWLRVGMALHASGEAWARAAWDSWSQRSDKYDAAVQDAKWESFTPDGGVNLATVFHLAQQHGYVPPKPRMMVGPQPTPTVPVDMTPWPGQAAVPAAADQTARATPAAVQWGTPGQQGPQALVDPDLLYTDNYNARALVAAYGAQLRYCFPWKSWLSWTGTHWQRDSAGVVMRAAKQTIKRLAQHLDLLSSNEARALVGHIKNSLSTARLKAMVESAQSEDGIPVQPEDLDRPKWLLNVENGTLDLHNGTLQAHQQTDLLTKCLQTPYEPAALCPTWERFLWRIMGGTDTAQDSEDDSALLLETRQKADERAHRLTAYLQRVIGYTLTGQTREQCLFLLHGDGSNGKSTFIELLQALLEDYAQSTPSASLLAKNRQDGIPNDIARLRGARLVSAVEIGEGRHLNEELVKRLTGQDTMTARFLFAEFFDFTPEFKLFIACNHLPHIQGTDHAIWRRIQRIPFTVTIPEAEQDKDLPLKLKAELPGILAWAVRGCLTWVREGLKPPEDVIAATTEYRASMDVIGRFIDECCLVGDAYRVKASDLYEAYKRWCEASGETSVTLTTFGTRLEDRGYRRHKIGAIWRLGIALNT